VWVPALLAGVDGAAKRKLAMLAMLARNLLWIAQRTGVPGPLRLSLTLGARSARLEAATPPDCWRTGRRLRSP
jgi:hypothetical protein